MGITAVPNQCPLLNKQPESHPAVHPAAYATANILGELPEEMKRHKLFLPLGEQAVQQGFISFGESAKGGNISFVLFSSPALGTHPSDKILLF